MRLQDKNAGRISSGPSATQFVFATLGPLHQVISIRVGAPDKRGQNRIDLRPEDEDRAEITKEQQRQDTGERDVAGKPEPVMIEEPLRRAPGDDEDGGRYRPARNLRRPSVSRLSSLILPFPLFAPRPECYVTSLHNDNIVKHKRI